MTGIKKRINQEAVLSFRLQEGSSYVETLNTFGLKPGMFYKIAKDGYIEGRIDDEELERCLIIERPTLDDFFDEVRKGERRRLPNGTHKSKQNNVSLVEIALESLDEYRSADREERIKIIRDKVLEYESKDGKNRGAQQFFHDNDLSGLMNNSPHLRKKDSPIALLELYDKERGIGLFDRTQKEYLVMIDYVTSKSQV